MTQPVSDLNILVTEFRRILPGQCATTPAIHRQKSWQRFAFNAVVALYCVAAGAALAEGAGRVQQLSGMLFVQRPDGAVRVLAHKSEVHPGDKLTTLFNSYAQINFIDGSSMTLRPNTQIIIESFKYLPDTPEADNAFFRLLKGGIRTVTGLVGKRGDMNAYKIGTTVVDIGIRGSSGDTLDCVTGCEGVSGASDRLERGVYHTTYTGSYVLRNESGLEIVNEGQVGFVKSTKSTPHILPKDPGLNLLNAPFMVTFASDRVYQRGAEDGTQRADTGHGSNVDRDFRADGGQRVGRDNGAGGSQGMGQGNGQSMGQGNGIGNQGMGQGNGIGQSMGQGNGIGNQGMGQGNGIGQSMGQGNGIGNQGMGQGNGNGNGNGLGVGQGMGRGFGIGIGGPLGAINGHGGGRR